MKAYVKEFPLTHGIPAHQSLAETLGTAAVNKQTGQAAI